MQQQLNNDLAWVFYEAYLTWQQGAALIMTLEDFVSLFFGMHGYAHE